MVEHATENCGVNSSILFLGTTKLDRFFRSFLLVQYAYDVSFALLDYSGINSVWIGIHVVWVAQTGEYHY